MQETVRRFLCAGCGTAVFICTTCDRGQRYCTGDCARTARQHSQREANRRYGCTPKGRVRSAARSQRYRDRRRVTDQGSLSNRSYAVLDASATTAVSEPPSIAQLVLIAAAESTAAIGDAVQCSFCRRWCGPWIRHVPLRRRSSRPRYVGMERLL